jgi:hypothetical protein
MSETPWLAPIINSPSLSRVRRNHGLEHATLHVLAQRHPRQRMAGHSDSGGFWIMAELPLEEVQAAVATALVRLQRGEHNLAVHPNCGTNYVTTGTLTGVSAALAMFGAGRRLRDKLERLPLAIILATLALLIAQPLGLLLQERVTTDGNPGNLAVSGIRLANQGKVKAYRITTTG